MGVPVVAKLGNSLPSRISGAILHAVGLTEWVADGDDEYVALAIRQATDLQALAQLRRNMRARIAASPAGDPEMYTQAVETAYRKMWCDFISRAETDNIATVVFADNASGIPARGIAIPLNRASKPLSPDLR